MSRETLYIFFILAKRNCHSSNSCQIDNINIFLNKKQPFSKLKNLIPTSKYKTLRLTGYSWGITYPTMDTGSPSVSDVSEKGGAI